MPGDEWHRRTTSAVAASSDIGEGDWLGLVRNPESRYATPMVAVPLTGLMDSATFAREFVLATIPLAHYMSLQDEDMWSAQELQNVSDVWDLTAEPLTDRPSTGTLAVVVVALQNLAVEAGREWIAAGFGRDRIHELWAADAGDPAEALFTWVSRRWDAELLPEESTLLPHRVITMGLDTDTLFDAVKSLAYLVADLSIAVEGDHGRFLRVLHPGRQEPVRSGVVSQPAGGDPWSAPGPDEEPPF